MSRERRGTPARQPAAHPRGAVAHASGYPRIRAGIANPPTPGAHRAPGAPGAPGALPGAAGCIERVARAAQCLLRMKRGILVSVLVLVVSAFVGSAFQAQAATRTAPAASAAQSTDAGSYWAAWSDAASH